MRSESSEGLYNLINETTSLALSKASKVVISTIIVRQDDQTWKGKMRFLIRIEIWNNIERSLTYFDVRIQSKT